jgi:uncharacterized protein YciI
VVRELESYAFVLLRRPADAPALPERELDALQERHLAYLDRLAEAGKLVAAGPFSDQPDESLRGLCFLRNDRRGGAGACSTGSLGAGGPPRGRGDDVVDAEGFGQL